VKYINKTLTLAKYIWLLTDFIRFNTS